jgi:hypothetical protein
MAAFTKTQSSGLAIVVWLTMALLMVGCQTTPSEKALQLPAASLETRQLQTRRFAEIGEAQLLSASAGVFQDLGFNLDESEVDLGLIVASKRATAIDAGFTRAMRLLEIFADIEVAVDKDQRIRASLVSWPVKGKTDEYFVRITFQRVVWNTENDITKRQALDDPILYQEFFERLSKSVFLEAHSI